MYPHPLGMDPCTKLNDRVQLVFIAWTASLRNPPIKFRYGSFQFAFKVLQRGSYLCRWYARVLSDAHPITFHPAFPAKAANIPVVRYTKPLQCDFMPSPRKVDTRQLPGNSLVTRLAICLSEVLEEFVAILVPIRHSRGREQAQLFHGLLEGPVLLQQDHSL